MNHFKTICLKKIWAPRKNIENWYAASGMWIFLIDQFLVQIDLEKSIFRLIFFKFGFLKKLWVLIIFNLGFIFIYLNTFFFFFSNKLSLYNIINFWWSIRLNWKNQFFRNQINNKIFCSHKLYRLKISFPVFSNWFLITVDLRKMSKLIRNVQKLTSLCYLLISGLFRFYRGQKLKWNIL